MPGFNINNGNGAGTGGFNQNGPANTLEVRRKHRWVFEALGRGSGAFSAAELLVLQSASRPNFKFEEPEMHHNQEVIRLAGKQDWEPVTLVWYDVEQSPDISKSIYAWIETVVNMQRITVAHPSQYKRQARLSLLNGFGTPTESWDMYGTWPVSVNWQELDYSTTDLLTIEASMRYDRATRQCLNSNERQANTPTCPP